MKKLLPFKRLDLYIQLASILLPWLFFMVAPGWGRVFQLEHVVASYCIVGVGQIASCLVNKFRLQAVYKAKSRLWYQRCLMILLVLMPASFMLKVLLFAFVVLLYVSPVLAVWYVGITIAELNKLRKPIPNIDAAITQTDVQ